MQIELDILNTKNDQEFMINSSNFMAMCSIDL